MIFLDENVELMEHFFAIVDGMLPGRRGRSKMEDSEQQ